jgi:antirestriction protein
MKSNTYDDSSGMPATPEKALCGSVSAKTWQPIDTAPTTPDEDGRLPFVLVACDSCGGPYVCEAYFDMDRKEWWPANTCDSDPHGMNIYPTHWMPLPEPPNTN